MSAGAWCWASRFRPRFRRLSRPNRCVAPSAMIDFARSEASDHGQPHDGYVRQHRGGTGSERRLPTQGVYSTEGEPSEPVFCPSGLRPSDIEILRESVGPNRVTGQSAGITPVSENQSESSAAKLQC